MSKNYNFQDDAVFKYADDEDVLKRLCGLNASCFCPLHE